ncbi:hypothetical protein [Metabacillus litoralis]|nr:hypothetical protein [Metabacillus litoralis]MCM3410166.1 hypothetical protein [Metabacillus litoralis]
MKTKTISRSIRNVLHNLDEDQNKHSRKPNVLHKGDEDQNQQFEQATCTS